MPNSRLHFRALYLLALLVLLPACAGIPFFESASLAKARALADNNEYAKAIAMADRQLAKKLDPSPAEQWRVLAEQLAGESGQFLRTEINRVDELVAADNWLQANRRVAQLREQLPASSPRADFFARFANQRQDHIDKTRSALLLLNSRFIPEQIQLQRQLHHAQPRDAAARKQWQRSLAASDEVLANLRVHLQLAEFEGQIDTALLYARAIARLAPSAEIDAVVAGLLQKLEPTIVESAAPDTPAPVVTSDLSEQHQQQLHDYGKALVNEEWLQARTVLDAMLIGRPRDSELLGQDTYLKEIFAEQVELAKKSGEQLYSAGEIEQALELWRAVLPMAPDDPQLTANIERAQRILSKVKALKEDSL